jgi:hypothetical protein
MQQHTPDSRISRAGKSKSELMELGRSMGWDSTRELSVAYLRDCSATEYEFHEALNPNFAGAFERASNKEAAGLCPCSAKRSYTCSWLCLPSLSRKHFATITIKPARSADPRNARVQVLPNGDLLASGVPVITLLSYAYNAGQPFAASFPSSRLDCS